MSLRHRDYLEDNLSATNSSDHNELDNDDRYVPQKPKWQGLSKRKKTCLFCLLGFGLCCLATCLIFAIVLGVYFGRKNVNIYPNPEYSSSDDFLRFLVVGDMGRADDGQKNVASSMGKYCKSKKCHFVIGIGDNIYNFGVDSVKDEQFKTKFEDIYNVDGIQDLKWHMLLGNHDYRGNVQAQIDYTKISNRWILPSHYYTLEKNSTLSGFDVSMVMLDTSPFISFWSDPLMDKSYLETQYPKKQDQLDMLEKVLSENQGKNNSWTLVFGHHHVYSGGIGGNNKKMMESILPILEKYQPPLYICGHVHLLNWLKEPKHKTNYLISGAGSGNIIWPVYNPFSLNVYSDPGFFSVEVQKDFLFVIALDMHGNEIFKFRIDK